MNVVVAAVKPWNIAAFGRRTPALPGSWHLVTEPEGLAQAVARLKPRYVFFPHWSWKVPAAVLEASECIGFHMTDLPYGRGGSPLQNLIERGHRHTVLSALRLVDELDAGPVYAKRPLSLDGSAQQVFERAAECAYDMMADIISTQPRPKPQAGDVVTFKRRTPDMSELPKSGALERLYDHIRMLDAQTYPKAFVKHGAFRLVLDEARLEDGRLSARVSIEPEAGDPS